MIFHLCLTEEMWQVMFWSLVWHFNRYSYVCSSWLVGILFVDGVIYDWPVSLSFYFTVFCFSAINQKTLTMDF